jgi:hypothetical protein
MVLCGAAAALIDLVVCADRLHKDGFGTLSLYELKDDPKVVTGAASP